ncbi:DUF4189 domain-containing protein [Nocardia sp. NPDC005825]|uniref:DUF4189 domain-containing protein n=1 Tax=unclassified Nocardia TaxID=2637762 RepID=UPI0034086113
MRLSSKAAAAVVASTAVVLCSGGMGTANAAVDYYGALAVSWDSTGTPHIVTATNYPSQAEADAAALANCDFSPCDVQARFVNGCIAVANRGEDFWFGTGRTREAAISKAVAATGQDPNPLLVSLGSAEPSRAEVIGSDCSDGS